MMAVSAWISRAGSASACGTPGLDLADDLDVHADGELARVEHRGHHDVAHARSLGRDRQLAGLDPRRVEDRVDEVQELEPALLDDRDALALTVGQGPARHEPGEPEDRVEGGLQVVAHRGEKEPPHPLGRRPRVDGPLLGAGELAEDAPELVGGVHQSRHRLKARVAEDAPAAQDVRDAGRLELALGERHVVAEGAAGAPPEHPRDRDRDEREAQVDARPGAQPRGPEAHGGVAVGEGHGQLGAALVGSRGREERDGAREVDVEAVRLRRLDRRLAAADVAVDGVEDALRELRGVVLPRRRVERAQVSVHEQRRAERDERHGRHHGREQPAAHARHAAVARVPSSSIASRDAATGTSSSTRATEARIMTYAGSAATLAIVSERSASSTCV